MMRRFGPSAVTFFPPAASYSRSCRQAQQLGLDLHWQIPDLVQEQGSAFGGLDLPPVIFDRPGEGSAHVAEEFAFQQTPWTGSDS